MGHVLAELRRWFCDSHGSFVAGVVMIDDF
jgi:hypothetical protein